MRPYYFRFIFPMWKIVHASLCVLVCVRSTTSNALYFKERRRKKIVRKLRDSWNERADGTLHTKSKRICENSEDRQKWKYQKAMVENWEILLCIYLMCWLRWCVFVCVESFIKEKAEEKRWKKDCNIGSGAATAPATVEMAMPTTSVTTPSSSSTNRKRKESS